MNRWYNCTCSAVALIKVGGTGLSFIFALVDKTVLIAR
jgi:hypothetical protein